MSAKKVIVIGMGNELLKDEGVGVHVAHAMQTENIPADIVLEVMETGTSSQQLLSVERVDKLIIIDAVQGGCEPGTIYRFRPDDIAVEKNVHLSIHQWGLFEGLKAIDYLGNTPGETIIIGIEPKEIDWGLELSTELKQRIPKIIELVWEEIHSGRRN